MMTDKDGNAIVYCQGAFNTTNGKTAHGLVRFTNRYRVLSVVDERFAGRDAGDVLDGYRKDIPIASGVQEAIENARDQGVPATHLVVGLAPDGGRLPVSARNDIQIAIQEGLNVDSGLHDYLSEDPDLSALAKTHGVQLRDIRKPPLVSELHFFSGKIEEVDTFKIAVLGTDSAVGKRTTAWLLAQGFQDVGFKAELIGTGQTAWLQGARYSIVLDSLVNDFVAGEIEHVVWRAWKEAAPDILVIEGQGSLMNPAYPGGFEILAAARPDVVVLQHAPARKEYDGFPGYKLHHLAIQIQAIELLSGKPVAAIAVNHEGIPLDRVGRVCAAINSETELPVSDVLLDGPKELVAALLHWKRRGITYRTAAAKDKLAV
jgi:uncharacterized NAD-dependent epimerase/dehydratase family protein